MQDIMDKKINPISFIFAWYKYALILLGKKSTGDIILDYAIADNVICL